jgi:hypothetical protein
MLNADQVRPLAKAQGVASFARIPSKPDPVKI